MTNYHGPSYSAGPTLHYLTTEPHGTLASPQMAPTTDPNVGKESNTDNNVATKRGGILRYFLKDDPAPELLDGLARLNETELDEAQVKRIERRIDMLIIPALAVCYMVRSGLVRIAGKANLAIVLLHVGFLVPPHNSG